MRRLDGQRPNRLALKAKRPRLSPEPFLRVLRGGSRKSNPTDQLFLTSRLPDQARRDDLMQLPSDMAALLTHAQTRACEMMVDLALRYSEVFPSVDYISNHRQMAHSTVYLALNRFEELGWLSRDKRPCAGCRWHRNLYRFAGQLLDFIEQRKAARRAAIAARQASIKAYVDSSTAAAFHSKLDAAVADAMRSYKQRWSKHNRAKNAPPPISRDNLSFPIIKKKDCPPSPPQPGNTAFLKRWNAGEFRKGSVP